MARKKKYQLQHVLVEKYAAEGKCIAYSDNKVIFIEGAVPNDMVTILVTKNKKDWAEAHVLEIEKYAQERISPFCIHFGNCGGCKWQMLPYAKQLEYKQQQVIDQLIRIGKVNIETHLPIIPCQKTTHYRNKIEFTCSNKQYLTTEELKQNIPFEKNVIGFHPPKYFDKVIDIEICHLQS